MDDHVSKKFTKKRSLLHFVQIGLDGVGTQPGSSRDSENLPVSFADDRQRSVSWQFEKSSFADCYYTLSRSLSSV